MATQKPRAALRALYHADPMTGALPEGTHHVALKSLTGLGLARPGPDGHRLTKNGYRRRMEMRMAVERYNQGQSKAQIAAALPVTPGTVSRWLEAADVLPRIVSPRVFSAAEEEEIIHAYLTERRTLQNIADEHSHRRARSGQDPVSVMAVSRTLERHGIPRRPRFVPANPAQEAR